MDNELVKTHKILGSKTTEAQVFSLSPVFQVTEINPPNTELSLSRKIQKSFSTKTKIQTN